MTVKTSAAATNGKTKDGLNGSVEILDSGNKLEAISSNNKVGGEPQNSDVIVGSVEPVADERTKSTNGQRAELVQHDSRFGGFAAKVEASVASSVKREGDHECFAFHITAAELSKLCEERTRLALSNALANGMENTFRSGDDVEAPSSQRTMRADVMKLVDQIRKSESPKSTGADLSLAAAEMDKNADIAANVLTEALLHSHPRDGIDPREVEHRRQIFGSNAIAEKKFDSFLKLCWEAVQDFVLIMLIVLGTISIVVETTTLEEGEKCGSCWVEGAAILATVVTVVLVIAVIDHGKQKSFIKLTKSLLETNTKAITRDGKQLSVVDDDIVVGDILSVNSHALASIPADCVLLGPIGDFRIDESALTGESKLVRKKPGDIVLSGTTAVEGSGKMIVVAVGIHSVAGRIKAQVYESEDQENDLEGGEEDTPLFVKLDLIAKQIGIVGTVAAVIAFLGLCIIGLAFKGEAPRYLVYCLIHAITVLAVAVPEGLPLAVTLALAFSSYKMMEEQNLVKHLDACETMGCATTICTDKTGTLTANKMTSRAICVGKINVVAKDPTVKLSEDIKNHGVQRELIELISRAISIDTMNETVLNVDSKGKIVGSSGNPTEVALLVLVRDLGFDHELIRGATKGRSDEGKLGEFLSQGKQYDFTSARKMMSWAVPLENGGYRIYCKGAQEVIISRSSKYCNDFSEEDTIDESVCSFYTDTATSYERRGMRCLCLAYRDLPDGFDLDALSNTHKNADGTDAYKAETDLTFLALVGIEDPLRPEVPAAIEQCYGAGIDVRLVTGDSPNTAVSIAYQAGILRDTHFVDEEKVAVNLKKNVLMEGQYFRQKVYRIGENGEKEFDQQAFDIIWPFLRVLARSSPDDKLTLAHGLNQSTLFADTELCKKYKNDHGINIFPDRQVVAMTGDGTNDAPALKRSDIGFAMGIAGTQIAKDAADIILLDDNFDSIVTAAKWGRNVYASIQKFLQFQLTVNIAALVTCLVGIFTVQKPPLAAIQLLWVNLLMDSLASLALASEPPVEALLKKPPVNRTERIITNRMWANMIGQSIYQIIVIMILLFMGPELLDVEPGHEFERRTKESSRHYSIIFNAFVLMQLFNEINSRMLHGELNVFKGIQNNPLFCGIILSTTIFQVIIVQFLGMVFHVKKGGIFLSDWIVCIILGSISLPVQQVINCIYSGGKQYRLWKNERRLRKAGNLATRGTHVHRD